MIPDRTKSDLFYAQLADVSRSARELSATANQQPDAECAGIAADLLVSAQRLIDAAHEIEPQRVPWHYIATDAVLAALGGKVAAQ